MIDALLPNIESYQTNYIKTSDVFFQGLKTNSTIPIVDTISDKLDTKPTGKSTTWTNTGLITGALPFSMSIDEYTSLLGKGYQITFTTSDGIDSYSRVVGYGIEKDLRTSDWKKINLFSLP